METHPADRRSLVSTLIALVVVALALRPQVIALGPLGAMIQADLDVSHGVVGLLSAIPVLCMGIFAPLGPRAARRLGARNAMAVCGRPHRRLRRAAGRRPARPGSSWCSRSASASGWACAGPILPMTVRRHLPSHPALGTGAYATGLVVGAAVAAALVVSVAGPPTIGVVPSGSSPGWPRLARDLAAPRPARPAAWRGGRPSPHRVVAPSRLGARPGLRAPVGRSSTALPPGWRPSTSTEAGPKPLPPSS